MLCNKTTLAVKDADSDSINCLILVSDADVETAKDAIAEAKDIWVNHWDSDECCDCLTNQIEYILDGRRIDYEFLCFEEA